VPISFNDCSETGKRHLLVGAAKKALDAQGYSLARVPGRGLSNVWRVTRNGATQVAAIRTTRDRWIAFPPLDGGSKWKTLDDVDLVVVAAVDSKENPQNIEIYFFPAVAVRKKFDANYAERVNQRQTVIDGFGMWVSLDRDDRGVAASAGSGIVDQYKRVAVYPIQELLANVASKPDTDEVERERGDEERFVPPPVATISEVVAWARERIAEIAGVKTEAVRLDLRIEY